MGDRACTHLGPPLFYPGISRFIYKFYIILCSCFKYHSRGCHVIRLLHVDDDETLLELSGHFLGQSGDLLVDTTVSGETAKEMLLQQAYDAIVSDYHMPGCSGIDLLRHVRQTDLHTPFLFFSDQKEEEAVIDALTSGADFFLPKGLRVRSQFIQLEHAIRESVKRRRAEQQHERVSSMLRIKEAAVRSSLCPIALCDTEGRIQYANPAGLGIWGYTNESEVIGKPATDFVVSPEITPTAIPELLQEKSWSGKAIARRKDGSTFDARVYVNVMTNESGHPLGFVASFTDLSRQKHARERLESYIRDIRFISKKASAMTDFPLDGDIYGFVADTFHDLVPPGAIVIISSVRAGSTIRVEAVRGAQPHLADIERIIGSPILGMTFHMKDEMYASMFPTSFIELDEGIDTITFGQLPPELSQKIQGLPFFEKIIGTSLSWGGKLHGVTVGNPPPAGHHPGEYRCPQPLHTPLFCSTAAEAGRTDAHRVKRYPARITSNEEKRECHKVQEGISIY